MALSNAIPEIDALLVRLYKVSPFRREKAINFVTKILSKIVDNPDEEKFKSMNHEKIKKKFEGFQCGFIVDLLLFAGFDLKEKNGRLVFQRDNISPVLRKLEDKQNKEEERLKQERMRVIEQNKKRMDSKEDKKKKAMKAKILAQHEEQMKLASQGIFNVKATVADRKGSGVAVNSLSYD